VFSVAGVLSVFLRCESTSQRRLLFEAGGEVFVAGQSGGREHLPGNSASDYPVGGIVSTAPLVIIMGDDVFSWRAVLTSDAIYLKILNLYFVDLIVLQITIH